MRPSSPSHPWTFPQPHVMTMGWMGDYVVIHSWHSTLPVVRFTAPRPRTPVLKSIDKSKVNGTASSLVNYRTWTEESNYTYCTVTYVTIYLKKLMTPPHYPRAKHKGMLASSNHLIIRRADDLYILFPLHGHTHCISCNVISMYRVVDIQLYCMWYCLPRRQLVALYNA